MKSKEERQLYCKEYRKNNKEEINSRQRKIYKNNKKELNFKQRERNKQPKKKICNSISASMRISLKGNKHGYHWENIAGYTLTDLMKHLEKHFTEGMTWQNYGEWHLDHKVPVSAFNYTKPEHPDFKRCWSLKNLQPLWASENISKGAKLSKPFQPMLPMELKND